MPQTDPGQLNNYLASLESFNDISTGSADFSIGGRSLSEVLPRLDALMMVLKSCKQDACRNPWRVLHPDGDVVSLQDALHSDFDAFYRGQPSVSFSACALGYMPELEGPMTPDVFSGQGTKTVWEGQKPLAQSFEYIGDPSWYT